ncbi:MAG TPA: peroxide stress protein YaaA [Nocardioidaceae bacterium]|nr:peroxide stress protein YaaA [Nocardioidaceae bacterium]
MLILLPPSEGKAAPVRGRPLDLDTLSFSTLTSQRRRMLDELGALCAGDQAKAAGVLGLGPTQHGEVARNTALWDAPTAPAARVYTGVLYAALDHQTLRGQTLRRVNRWVAVQSALFGLVRLGDRIPAYRLPGDVSLPGVGKVSGAWRDALATTVPDAAGSGLVVDLRSSAYAAFWRPDRRTASIRVLQETAGRRTVVSHFNKATKGRLVRALAEDGATPRNAGELVEHLRGLGWHAESNGPGRVDLVTEPG